MAGLEVVLGNGEVVRTGQFAINNSPLAHISKYSFGPSIEGLFIQSNLGVVTKLGIWLTPQPQAYICGAIDMPEFEDIAPMVDLLGQMKRNGTLASSAIYVNNILELTASIGNREALWEGEGPIPESRVKELQKKFDFGYWHAQFGLYGPKIVVQAQLEEVQRVFKEGAPTARVRGKLFAGDNEGDLLDPTKLSWVEGGVFVGVPGMDVLPMVKYRILKDKAGVPAHADYSVFIPSEGEKVLEWVKTAKAIHERENSDWFCNFNVHERHVLGVHLMAFDKADPAQRKAVDRIWFSLYPEAVKRGYGSYRCHVNHMGRFGPKLKICSIKLTYRRPTS